MITVLVKDTVNVPEYPTPVNVSEALAKGMTYEQIVESEKPKWSRKRC
jgi:hypothetical protein